MEKEKDDKKEIIEGIIDTTLSIYKTCAEMLLNSFKDISYDKQRDTLDEELWELAKKVKTDREISKIVESDKILECRKALEEFTESHSKQIKAFDNIYASNNNEFYPCNNCYLNNSKTTKLECNHLLCDMCIQKAYCNKYAVSYKCLVSGCYYIHDSEYFRKHASKSVKPLKKVSECIICGAKGEKLGAECDHKLCHKCFKGYGEHVTKGEVLIKNKNGSGNSDKDEKYYYKRIECPYPKCNKTLDPMKLLDLYTEKRKEFFKSNAEGIFQG